MREVVLQLVLMVILSQTAAAPILIGSIGRQISAEDATDLQSVVQASAGSRPWLLIGNANQASAFLQVIQAYLPSETSAAELRRGAVVKVLRRLAPDGASQIPWTIRETGRYAQVVVAGRAFDSILDDQDNNRPFEIIGQFDDAAVVRIVTLIRSSAKTLNGLKQVSGNLPIASMRQVADDSVEVWLHGRDFQEQRVNIRRMGSTWMIWDVADGVA